MDTERKKFNYRVTESGIEAERLTERYRQGSKGKSRETMIARESESQGEEIEGAKTR